MSEPAARQLLLDARSVEFGYPARANSGAHPGFWLGPITIDLYPREFLAIIGPNGSGKSTLLRLLGGLLPAAGGSVAVGGADVGRLSPRGRAQRIAMVRQEAPLVFPVTVEQFVLLGRSAYADRFGFESDADRAAARAAMEATQICSFAKRRIDEISGGERQRVVLARALAQQPALLLLDEPTANLDLCFQLELLRMVRRLTRDRDLGVVSVMHEVNLASEFADYILLMRAGKLYKFGTPEEVLTARALEEVYGVPVRVDWNPASGRPHVTVIATASL